MHILLYKFLSIHTNQEYCTKLDNYSSTRTWLSLYQHSAPSTVKQYWPTVTLARCVAGSTHNLWVLLNYHNPSGHTLVCTLDCLSLRLHVLLVGVQMKICQQCYIHLPTLGLATSHTDRARDPEIPLQHSSLWSPFSVFNCITLCFCLESSRHSIRNYRYDNWSVSYKPAKAANEIPHHTLYYTL